MDEIAQTPRSEGVEPEIGWIGTKAVQGCMACNMAWLLKVAAKENSHHP